MVGCSALDTIYSLIDGRVYLLQFRKKVAGFTFRRLFVILDSNCPPDAAIARRR
jgi:hypothetical protein